MLIRDRPPVGGFRPVWASIAADLDYRLRWRSLGRPELADRTKLHWPSTAIMTLRAAACRLAISGR